MHCADCQLNTLQSGIVIASNQAQGSGGAVYLDNCDGFTAQGLQLHNNR